ncbi:hypothetical protein GBAR_LOCUS748 [Geodia barretti]|uniref:Uncharacterized protein n=1 Tax=Geodia barretti TaxID=519541 RepID=A0AA35QTG4_GEOBA|nr:hypothetical protein GBAR_LOCUS748 [Geodia barretti]
MKLGMLSINFRGFCSKFPSCVSRTWGPTPHAFCLGSSRPVFASQEGHKLDLTAEFTALYKQRERDSARIAPHDPR